MKINFSKLLIARAVSGIMSIGVATTAVAATGMKHNVADFNKDGMVTTEELVTYVQMNFLKMDLNNDKMLDGNEWDDLWWADAE